jgi:hypothetical protein
METWRKVWRDGIAPQLSTPALQALHRGLRRDDPDLLSNGATTEPPFLSPNDDASVDRACALVYANWKGNYSGNASVCEVENDFFALIVKCTELCGYPQAAKDFLNWIDDTPRPEMIASLMPEVVTALTARGLTLPAA